MTEKMTFSNKFIYEQLWFYSEGYWVHGSKDRIKFQIHFVIISILNRCVGDLKAEISNVGLHRQTMFSDYCDFIKFHYITWRTSWVNFLQVLHKISFYFVSSYISSLKNSSSLFHIVCVCLFNMLILLALMEF